ncbi:hypothetical protein D3C71_2175250 [compost metagenome]
MSLRFKQTNILRWIRRQVPFLVHVTKERPPSFKIRIHRRVQNAGVLFREYARFKVVLRHIQRSLNANNTQKFNEFL